MSSSIEVYRFLIALPRGQRQVFLSWRLLERDVPNKPFHVERRKSSSENWIRVTREPIFDSTNFLDTTPESGRYDFRIVTDDEVSETITVDSSSEPTVVAMSFPLPVPARDVQHIVAGDMLNDRRMGYVLRAVRGGTIWLFAYSHEGRRLWSFDTKLPTAGGWDGSTLHVPFLCWDVNNDGRTEVAFHSFRGHYPNETYEKGIPGELLTVLDSETGELVWEAPWPATKSRVMMTVGHLKGIDKPASLVIQDGTYESEGYVQLTAIDGKTGRTEWQVKQSRSGGHNLDIADIDGDGSQEVICGGICYNGDGSIRWEAEPFGHTDISKPAKIVPNIDGLQIWYAVENVNPGVYLIDKDGKTIFKEPFRHAHYGWVARHTRKFLGLQPHTAEDARHEFGGAQAGMREAGHFPIFLSDGSHWLDLTDWQRKNFVPVHWDEGPEVVFIIRKENKRIVRLKENGDIEDIPNSKLPEAGRYGRNLLCADVLGDFREEIVTVDEEKDQLIILSNPNLAHCRGFSPYDNFEYRHDRSQHGSGYYIYVSPPYTVVNFPEGKRS